MRRSSCWTGAVLMVAAATAVTGCSSGSAGGRAETKVAKAVEQPTAGGRSTGPAADNGDLVVSYHKPKTAKEAEAEKFLKDNKVLESVAAYANEQVKLPYDVPLKAAHCGQANAFWNPKTKDITYCYEFFDTLKSVYRKQETEGSAKQRAKAVDQDLVGLTNGVLFHEFGHGLIAMYDLPTTGEEEDAVDQLSVLLLASGDDTHQEYAIDTINAWAGLAQLEKAGNDNGNDLGQYADEHSLSIQRYYNWACWLYGSNPSKYKSIVATKGNKDGVLPVERAQRCPQEYAKIASSWATLLKPYLKD